MKPLATHQRVLTWLCICPAENHTSKWKKSLYILLVFALFVVEVSAVVSSLVFFLKNVSEDLEESLYALFVIVGDVCLTYGSLVLFYKRHEITAFLEELEQIFAISKNFHKI